MQTIQSFQIQLSSLQLLRRVRTWIRIFLLGWLIALGIALWPTASCAVGQCDARDQWCNGDCSQGCTAASGVSAVISCSATRGGGCFEIERQVGTRCENGGDCNVTWVETLSDRYSYSGGYSYWAVGKCEWNGCWLNESANVDRVDCCGGGEVEPPCTSSFAPPRITLSSTTPNYPLVYGQDPDKTGVTVNITVQGGPDLGGCGNSINVTQVTLDDVSLDPISENWIVTSLASRYPGAKVLDSYPQQPNYGLSSALPAAATTLSFHLNALDPGYYNARVTATQADGKTTSEVMQFPIYLLDSTLTLPGKQE